MQQELLDHLKKITEEEQKILDGRAEVDKELYTSGRDFIVDSRKMLDEGKLITVRTHTRFIHFPVHRHMRGLCHQYYRRQESSGWKR